MTIQKHCYFVRAALQACYVHYSQLQSGAENRAVGR